MKIRVNIPPPISQSKDASTKFTDDILLWGMETGLDVALYTITPNFNHFIPRGDSRIAVFTVEGDMSFMFSLKWGAMLYKSQDNNAEKTVDMTKKMRYTIG